MTEQKLRAWFFAETDTIASQNFEAYHGFKLGTKAERKRCHDFLMNLHMQAGGKHNYYHVAANQLLEEE